MRLKIKKTDYLQGDITLPGSKSQAVRAILFAMLSHGTSHLSNIPLGDDIGHAISVARALGARVTQYGSELEIQGRGLPIQSTEQLIYTGDSGITTRFVMPLLGLRANSQQAIELDCGEQMRQRPMASLIHALRDLGMTIETNDYPLNISGNLIGGKTQVEGLSSQFISALLIALPLAPEASDIMVENLNERPYLDMTLQWLNRLGVKITHHHDKHFDRFMIPGHQHYQPFHYIVPGDFSSASYFMAAGAMIPGEIRISGFNLKDAQGDKQFIDILKEMGADIHLSSSCLTLKGGKPLSGICVDANAIPDLLPTLAVLGCYAEGETRIQNVPQARFKETDRIASMAQNLTLMGAKIEEKQDGLVIKHSALRAATLSSFGDHRTVMALSLAGMLAEGETIIEDAQAINKTFPQYTHELMNLGAKLGVDHG
jgi:3-phosphoshikimate 1-carboxyvinyltransferase